jgi:hypothetical protein
VIEANLIKCHIIAAPGGRAQEASIAWSKYSIGIVTRGSKAFREDALAAGLMLPVAAQRAAE